MPWQPGQTLEQAEKEVILLALAFYQGNKSQTARALSIAPNTLAAKLDQYQSQSQFKQEVKKDAVLQTANRIHVQPVEKPPTKPTVPVRKSQKV